MRTAAHVFLHPAASSTFTSVLCGLCESGTPRFAAYNVIPRVADLTWANGAIQTPHGIITVSWTTNSKILTLSVSSPPRTVGRLGAASGGIVTVNGKKVWSGTAPVIGSGYIVTVVGGFVVAGGIPSGTHTLVRTPK